MSTGTTQAPTQKERLAAEERRDDRRELSAEQQQTERNRLAAEGRIGQRPFGKDAPPASRTNLDRDGKPIESDEPQIQIQAMPAGTLADRVEAAIGPIPAPSTLPPPKGEPGYPGDAAEFPARYPAASGEPSDFTKAEEDWARNQRAGGTRSGPPLTPEAEEQVKSETEEREKREKDEQERLKKQRETREQAQAAQQRQQKE